MSCLRKSDAGHTLHNLAGTLSQLGRHKEALAISTEVVEVYRRLAEANPAAFEPDLALSLWGFAWVRVTGKTELPAALTAAQESVSRLERLAHRLPQAYTNYLRGALATLANALDAVGRGNEAADVRRRMSSIGTG